MEGNTALYLALLVVFVSMLGIGGLGLSVLMDETGEGALTKTQFGIWYKWLSHKHTYFAPFVTNGGLIGTIWCINKLGKKLRSAAIAHVSQQHAASTNMPPAAAAAGDAQLEGSKKEQ